MLSFLYPAFLIGAAAAAIPILLHLLRNQQAPELRFSAVRLLLGVRVEQTQRRRIRDWLLLAFRVAALVLLALAFARPYVVGEGEAGGRATIVAIDRSASMSVPGAWARAVDAARRAIDAHAGEPVGLLAFDDQPELLVEPTRDRGALRGALERIAPGIGGTQYAGALSRASAALEESGATDGALVLIGDLQGSSASVRGAIPRGIAVEVVDVGRPFANVALIAARRQEDAIAATVRNDAPGRSRVRLQVLRDGRPVGGSEVDVPEGQVAEARIPAAAGAELQVVVQGQDDLPVDNVRYVTAAPPARRRILIVSGPGDAFYLNAALSAGAAAEFDVSAESASRLGAVLARSAPDVVVLVNPRGLDRGGREALRRFVEAGGGLFVAGGAEAGDTMLAPLLEDVSLAGVRDEGPAHLASFDGRHPLFQGMSGAQAGLAHARFRRSWLVRAQDWRTLARFDDGTAALMERAEGSGRILLFASDLNRAWNDLPLQPSFVVFTQELTRYLAPRAERDELTPASIPGPAGARLGFAHLEDGRRVAVNLDPRESDSARMAGATFADAIRRTAPVAPAAERRRIEAAESAHALWRYGLMLMLATLVSEGLLARRPRTP